MMKNLAPHIIINILKKETKIIHNLIKPSRLHFQQIYHNQVRMHGSHNDPPKESENPIHVKFIYTQDQTEIPVLARESESILDVAHNNGVDLEGACESSLACSTCHCILEFNIYNKLKTPCEEEEDLLDLAYGLT